VKFSLSLGIDWQESLVIALIILFQFVVPVAVLLTAIIVTLRSEGRSTCQDTCVAQVGPSGVDGWPSGWVGWLIGATVLHYVALLGIQLAAVVYLFGSPVWTEESWRFALFFGAAGLTAIVSMGLLVVYLIVVIKSSLPIVGKFAWSIALLTISWLTYPFALYFLVLRRRRIRLA